VGPVFTIPNVHVSTNTRIDRSREKRDRARRIRVDAIDRTRDIDHRLIDIASIDRETSTTRTDRVTTKKRHVTRRRASGRASIASIVTFASSSCSHSINIDPSRIRRARE